MVCSEAAVLRLEDGLQNQSCRLELTGAVIALEERLEILPCPLADLTSHRPVL